MLNHILEQFFQVSHIQAFFLLNHKCILVFFRDALAELKAIAADLAVVESGLQESGAPWTPGRIPDWP